MCCSSYSYLDVIPCSRVCYFDITTFGMYVDMGKIPPPELDNAGRSAAVM